MRATIGTRQFRLDMNCIRNWSRGKEAPSTYSEQEVSGALNVDELECGGWPAQVHDRKMKKPERPKKTDYGFTWGAEDDSGRRKMTLEELKKHVSRGESDTLELKKSTVQLQGCAGS
jgi:hypothetical protein